MKENKRKFKTLVNWRKKLRNTSFKKKKITWLTYCKKRQHSAIESGMNTKIGIFLVLKLQDYTVKQFWIKLKMGKYNWYKYKMVKLLNSIDTKYKKKNWKNLKRLIGRRRRRRKKI